MKKKIIAIGIIVILLLTASSSLAAVVQKRGTAGLSGGYIQSLIDAANPGDTIYSRINISSQTEQNTNLKITTNDNTWMKIYSRFYNVERGISVQPTTDDGYIICGGYYQNLDMWLIKTDLNGNIEWDKEFADVGGKFVQQTVDGGYIIIGDVAGNASLIKTDKDGDILWEKTYGDKYEAALHGQQTNDEGYIFTGYWSDGGCEDLWVVKTDKNGYLEWEKVVGGQSVDRGRSVKQTNDGGYIITGTKGLDVWLIKMDASGNIEWDKTFAGCPGYNVSSKGYSVQQTFDGGYAIIGQRGDCNQDYDIWLIKTDENGNMMWNNTFGDDDHEEGAVSGHQTSDHGYIMIGYTATKPPISFVKDIFLLKTDEYGMLEWSRTFGWNYFDWGNYVQQTNDGGYILTGVTDLRRLPIDNIDEDLLFIKTDEQGEFVVSPRYPYSIEGKTSCKPGVECTYKTSSLHLDSKKMRFGWDWGDDSNIEWTDFYDSGEQVETTHKWTEKGTYKIRVKAKDVYGAESQWSEPLSINIEKKKESNNKDGSTRQSVISRLLDGFRGSTDGSDNNLFSTILTKLFTPRTPTTNSSLINAIFSKLLNLNLR